MAVVLIVIGQVFHVGPNGAVTKERMGDAYLDRQAQTQREEVERYECRYED
jgi:hypothetical protein